MDLDLTSEQELLRETSARFIQDTYPLEAVRRTIDGGDPPPAGYAAQAAELGWFALLVPEELGGGSVSGKGMLDAAVVAEERGRALQPGPFVATNVVAVALAEFGTDQQKADVLPGILAGETVATWALSDRAGDWSGTAGVEAVAKGDAWVLNGEKGMVVDAATADWLLVTAATASGPSQFLVPSGTAGVTAVAQQGLDLSRSFGRVGFEDAEVPASALVGEAGGAAAALDRQLQVALALTVNESVGAMNAHFAMALEYAKERTAFGRPIGSFQGLKHQIADTSLLLEKSNGMSLAAARAVANGADDAAEVTAMAKSFVSDAGVELAQKCFQVFGGIGFTWEHDNHLFLRRLTADASLYGQPAWHRERICTMYGL